ncbi:MAG: hypothetical protein HW421_3208 [Ignavibacteria bacterium]|nr:hypothetical protein [Ignavibacteria bacterium]
MLAQVENLFNKVDSLPEELQNNLVFYWNEDIENELNFDKSIFETSAQLKIMAQEALNEYNSGNTLEKGFDEL